MKNKARGLAHLPLAATLLALTAAGAAAAQSPVGQVTGPTRSTAVPLSGRTSQEPPVLVQQQTAPSPTGSSQVLNTTVTVQGPFTGSAVEGKATGGLIQLSLEQALSMGMRRNLGVLTDTAAVDQSAGARTVARSALLPDVNVAGAEVFTKSNLRAQGVELDIVPTAAKFNYFDARVLLNQTALDFVRLHDLHAASENLSASKLNAANARDVIVLAVGGSYLQLVATQARLDTEAADVATARTIFQQAQDRFEAGLAARLDAMRAQVQYQTEQQRLRSLQADQSTQQLKLARLIGLPASQLFTTTNGYPYAPLSGFTVDTALDRAMQQRLDLQAASAGVRAAESSVKAAHAERLPSVNLHGEFGAEGLTPTRSDISVFNVYGTVTVPIYNGGRVRGDEQQAQAAWKQRKSELEDTRGQVEQDVRQAFIDLNAADDQVTLAKSNAALAHATLTQSLDRFAAGITDTVEVVQAEQSVVEADDEYVTAVYQHNLGKLLLARAMGNAEQTLPQLLRK